MNAFVCFSIPMSLNYDENNTNRTIVPAYMFFFFLFENKMSQMIAIYDDDESFWSASYKLIKRDYFDIWEEH